MDLNKGRWACQFDQATKRYILEVPGHYYIPVQSEYGLVELLEFLSKRSGTFFTAVGEALEFSGFGLLMCRNPDAWMNREHQNGIYDICDINGLAKLVAGAIKEFIDGKFEHSGR